MARNTTGIDQDGNGTPVSAAGRDYSNTMSPGNGIDSIAGIGLDLSVSDANKYPTVDSSAPDKTVESMLGLEDLDKGGAGGESTNDQPNDRNPQGAKFAG